MKQFSSEATDFEIDFDKKTISVGLKNHIKQGITAVVLIELDDRFVSPKKDLNIYFATKEDQNEINKIREKHEDNYQEHIADILRPIAQKAYFEAHFNRKKHPVIIKDERKVTTPLPF